MARKKKPSMKEIGAKGGKARAAKLSPAERSEIARFAAETRHGTRTPRALYGSPDRPLKIGEAEIECYVLEDETRVISQRGFLRALGRTKSPRGRETDGDGLPAFLRAKSLNSYISKDLATATDPIEFVQPRGGRAHGYKAELLPKICEVYLKAREDGALAANQLKMAKAAEIIMRGLAHVGIIALVDEATGFQDARTKAALAEILERFIADELKAWVKTFPTEFYRQIYRLNGWDFRVGNQKRPQVVGKYTNDIVYERLAPGVLEELRKQTPRDEKGRFKQHLHRRLTREVGHPRLREHLLIVTNLMRASQDWDEFKQLLDRAKPRYDPNRLPFYEDIYLD